MVSIQIVRAYQEISSNVVRITDVSAHKTEAQVINSYYDRHFGTLRGTPCFGI